MATLSQKTGKENSRQKSLRFILRFGSECSSGNRIDESGQNLSRIWVLIRTYFSCLNRYLLPGVDVFPLWRQLIWLETSQYFSETIDTDTMCLVSEKKCRTLRHYNATTLLLFVQISNCIPHFPVKIWDSNCTILYYSAFNTWEKRR